MTMFRATHDDLESLIQDRQSKTLKWALRFPLGALAVGVGLLPLTPMLASFALGAAAAWGWSAIMELRSVRSTVLWSYAWLLEDVTVAAEAEGLRLGSARGESFLRWDGGIRVVSKPDFFMIQDEGEDFFPLPKKYLAEAELLVLNARAAEP